jgi:hypothetical protein
LLGNSASPLLEEFQGSLQGFLFFFLSASLRYLRNSSC